MFTIVNVTELALGANVALADMTRLTWKTKEANSSGCCFDLISHVH